MSKTERNQQLLNWLNKEKKKDQIEIEKQKEIFLNQIRQFKKEEIISKPKKLSLWQKLKIVILGH